MQPLRGSRIFSPSGFFFAAAACAAETSPTWAIRSMTTLRRFSAVFGLLIGS